VDAAFEKGAAAAVCTQAHERGPCLVVENPLLALQHFAAAHRKDWGGPLLAITGSCGKTTSKDFCAAVLGSVYPKVAKTKGNLNNEIGCPLSLLQLGADTGMAVMELGANHPGEIRMLAGLAKPTESAITMIAPAHLEGFGSVEGVAAAKAEIMEALDETGCYYVNNDDPRCRAIGERFSGKKIYFGKEGDVALEEGGYTAGGELTLLIDPVGRITLPLPVLAHATNVLLAVAVGLQHGATEFEAPMRAACKAHARVKTLRIGPIEVIDDTYNASPASMIAALEALAARPGKGKRIAALGGMMELGEDAEMWHRKVGEAAGRCKIAHVFTFGPHGDAMLDAALNNGVPHGAYMQTHQAMAAAIAEIVEEGDLLLLKGSRLMKMESLIPELEKLFAAVSPQSGGDAAF
jgi:UDP-N-acetylmuramoyl-tripeptide--D-alanyl-D-alanine ligase